MFNNETYVILYNRDLGWTGLYINNIIKHDKLLNNNNYQDFLQTRYNLHFL